MAPPVRKLPAGYALAVGGHRGHKVTKHKAQRPSRTPRVSRTNFRSYLFFNFDLQTAYI